MSSQTPSSEFTSPFFSQIPSHPPPLKIPIPFSFKFPLLSFSYNILIPSLTQNSSHPCALKIPSHLPSFIIPSLCSFSHNSLTFSLLSEIPHTLSLIFPPYPTSVRACITYSLTQNSLSHSFSQNFLTPFLRQASHLPSLTIPSRNLSLRNSLSFLLSRISSHSSLLSEYPLTFPLFPHTPFFFLSVSVTFLLSPNSLSLSFFKKSLTCLFEFHSHPSSLRIYSLLFSLKILCHLSSLKFPHLFLLSISQTLRIPSHPLLSEIPFILLSRIPSHLPSLKIPLTYLLLEFPPSSTPSIRTYHTLPPPRIPSPFRDSVSHLTFLLSEFLLTLTLLTLSSRSSLFPKILFHFPFLRVYSLSFSQNSRINTTPKFPYLSALSKFPLIFLLSQFPHTLLSQFLHILL